MDHPQIAHRAADAIQTLTWLRATVLDHPRIISDCAHYTDLSGRAADVAALAAKYREIADALDRTAVTMAGAPKLREVA